jgi:hypothetical protein
MSGKVAQLRLVQDPAPAHGVTQDPCRQVFEQWVALFGMCRKRTKLDDERRAIINSLLVTYGLEDTLLGVEGAASVPMGGQPETMVETVSEIAWFGAKASRFEKRIRHGEKVRAMLQAEAEMAQCRPVVQCAAVLSPEEQAAAAQQAADARARMQARMAELRARHG